MIEGFADLGALESHAIDTTAMSVEAVMAMISGSGDRPVPADRMTTRQSGLSTSGQLLKTHFRLRLKSG